MSIERDYFWFWLFKARGIGPKSLISIAKILEKEDRHPEMLPRIKVIFRSNFRNYRKFLIAKFAQRIVIRHIRSTSNSECKASSLSTQGILIFHHISSKSRRCCSSRGNENFLFRMGLQSWGRGMCQIRGFALRGSLPLNLQTRVKCCLWIRQRCGFRSPFGGVSRRRNNDNGAALRYQGTTSEKRVQ